MTSTITTILTFPTATTSLQPCSEEFILRLAVPLAGGELFSGITLVLTLQMLYRYGTKVGIKNDLKRQILLNLICLICSINTIISYGFNATGSSVLVSNITTVITFMCVQYGLVILNHNTAIRLSTVLSSRFPHDRSVVDRICLVFYLLPWLVFIPIYLAIDEKWTRAEGKMRPFNTSVYNLSYYKFLNIGLVITTELLAVSTDIILLLQVAETHSRLKKLASPMNLALVNPTTLAAVAATSTNATTTTSTTMTTTNMESSSMERNPRVQAFRMFSRLSRDFIVNYGLTWALVILDVTIKSLIATGQQAFLFDSIVSVATIAMRSRANLVYGLELQHILGMGQDESNHHHHQQQINNNNPNNTISTPIRRSASYQLQFPTKQ